MIKLLLSGAALPCLMLLAALSAGCNLTSGDAELQADANAPVQLAAAPATEAAAPAPEQFILASTTLENGHVAATFAVEGMTCGGCEGFVESTVAKVTGVDSCEASSKNSTATVTYDPAQTNPELLLASLQSTGFKLKPVKTDAAAGNVGCSADGKSCSCKSGGECSCCGDCKCADSKACDINSGTACSKDDDGKKTDQATDSSDTQASVLNRLIAAAFPAAHAAEEKPAEKKKLPQLPPVTKGCERATFSVEYCCAGGCPPNTEKAVKALKGVAYVKADYPTLTCTVDFRPKEISKDKIKTAILDLGYVVDGTEPTKPHKD